MKLRILNILVRFFVYLILLNKDIIRIMREKILEFINKNWVNTIVKDNKELPCPYNSPNTGIYSDFYYWDLEEIPNMLEII